MISKKLSPLALVLAPTLAACGGPPPAAPPPPPKAETAAPSAAPIASAAPEGNAAAEQCLAAASAKRAKYSGEPPKVGVKHVLVKYKGSKSADASITRSRTEACLR